MPKLPYPRYKTRLKTVDGYASPRNPTGKRTPRFVKLRLTNYARKDFYR